MSLQLLHKGTQNGVFRMVLALGLAIALLIPVTLTASAQALQPGGTSCVDGLVIDWQENPIEEGWFVRAIADDAAGTTVYVLPSDEDDEEGQFEINDDPHLFSEDWSFEVIFRGEENPNFDDTQPESETNPRYIWLDDEGNEVVDAPLADLVGVAPLLGDWRGVTPVKFDITLDTESGKCTRVRFKLKEIVTVLVTKIDADHTLLGDWTIIATPDKSNKFAIQQDGETSDENEGRGGIIFELTPGKWIFTEESPDDVGDDYYPVIPANGQQTLDVQSAQDRADDDDPGNDYVPALVDYPLRFKNEVGITGCIQVLKTDLAPEESEFNANFPLAGWEISILRADGSEQTFGYTDATGMVKFEGLPFGPYTIKEETRVGWDLVTELVLDEIYVNYDQAQTSSVEVSLTDSDCVLVKFVNEQADAHYFIEGRKLDVNGHYGIPGWKIEAKALDKGGEDLDPVFTDGNGYYKFELPGDDYRIPGARYQICEDDDVDGWENVSSTCYTVTVPKTLGSTAKVPDFVNRQVGHHVPMKTSWSGGWSKMDNMGNMGKMDGMKCSKYHEVMAGEGLYSIGEKYMKPAGAMLAANPKIAARTNQYVYTGEKVCIP